MKPEVVKATTRGAVATAVLGGMILLGSRNLAHFDAALVAYTFSILFATFGLTYRYSMWLSRPPTAMYWRRGWQAFSKRGWRLRNARFWLARVGQDVIANRFIFRRDPQTTRQGLTDRMDRLVAASRQRILAQPAGVARLQQIEQEIGEAFLHLLPDYPALVASGILLLAARAWLRQPRPSGTAGNPEVAS